jgi:hypothetical protein
MTIMLRRVSRLCLIAALIQTSLFAATYHYDGDMTPSAGQYGNWFTTVGPGHPTGSYFLGTTWGSDGDVLTMTTQHPSDFPGATSQGIWFGRGTSYGDFPQISLATAALGNAITARMALAPNSSEWSMYMYDSSGYGASFYFLSGGFNVGVSNQSLFFPRADMTSFHEYGMFLHQGTVSYTLDGVVIAAGNVSPGGAADFFLVGDGSASSVSGFGSLLVDSLTVTTEYGPIPVPEPGLPALLAVAVAAVRSCRRRR